MKKMKEAFSLFPGDLFFHMILFSSDFMPTYLGLCLCKRNVKTHLRVYLIRSLICRN